MKRPAKRQLGKTILRHATSMFLIGLTVLVCLLSLAGPHGLLQLRKVNRELDMLQTKNKQLDTEIIDLNNRIYGVQRSDFVLEKTAREELGFAKPGEVVYVFPDSEGKTEHEK